MREWFIEQSAMYAAYHRDKRNQITHYIGVPMIVLSLFIIMWGVDLFTVGNITVNLTLAISTLLLSIYSYISLTLGILLIIDFAIGLWIAHWVVGFGGDVQLYSFIGLFIVGWVIQFWGHVYEGRKPALFDNLVQIFMAPFFLAAEAMFAMGKLEDLHKEIEAQTHKYEA